MWFLFCVCICVCNEQLSSAQMLQAFLTLQQQHQYLGTPLISQFVEEPLYVNAKQYYRILKRRQQRAKLEQENKLPRQRKVSNPQHTDTISLSFFLSLFLFFLFWIFCWLFLFCSRIFTNHVMNMQWNDLETNRVDSQKYIQIDSYWLKFSFT